MSLFYQILVVFFYLFYYIFYMILKIVRGPSSALGRVPHVEKLSINCFWWAFDNFSFFLIFKIQKWAKLFHSRDFFFSFGLIRFSTIHQMIKKKWTFIRNQTASEAEKHVRRENIFDFHISSFPSDHQMDLILQIFLWTINLI